MSERRTSASEAGSVNDSGFDSQQAIETLKEKLPMDRWPDLEQATEDFRAALRERRTAVQNAGLNDPNEVIEHLRIMRNTAIAEMQSATGPEEFVDCLERAADAVRNAPLQDPDDAESEAPADAHAARTVGETNADSSGEEADADLPDEEGNADSLGEEGNPDLSDEEANADSRR